MKRTNGTVMIVGVGALLAGAACSSPSKPASSIEASPSAVQVGSTLVDCGSGQRLLLEQASGLTRAVCVPGDATAPALGMADRPQPIRVDADVPEGAYGPAAARQASYEPRQAPVTTPRTVVKRGRSWKKSAAIIGGSTAAGAGVGAIMDGGSGAKKGAVVGLVGGVVYDIATRDR